ncbi:hypothetical protein VTO42DRAFT_3635 [Malbranchea cinnamomea]
MDANDVRVVEDTSTSRLDDMTGFHIDQSSDFTDRPTSPAPTYRTVESYTEVRPGSPAPSYATVDPLLDRPAAPTEPVEENVVPLHTLAIDDIVDSQRRIEELIRQEQLKENMKFAFEHHPESYGTVEMLYVPFEINGYRTKAMVGSGAMATIISADFAAACGIMSLVDRRFTAAATGVGTMHIAGVVRSINITVGHITLLSSLQIMSQNLRNDVLLGLDVLKRYQACIDLTRNALVFQNHAVYFLPGAGQEQDQKSTKDRDEKRDTTRVQIPAISGDQQSWGPQSIFYVPVEINGFRAKAAIDSASQATIILPACAECFDIMRLIDYRYRGTATGIGSAAILGRIHSVSIKIGNFHFHSSLTVIESHSGQRMPEILLGLDVLCRLDACIDLKQNALFVRGELVPFLPGVDSNTSTRGISKSKSSADGEQKDSLDHKHAATFGDQKQNIAPRRPAPAPPTKVERGEISPALRLSHWSEELISKITEMGFGRDDAAKALDETNGDLELAISVLIETTNVNR